MINELHPLLHYLTNTLKLYFILYEGHLCFWGLTVYIDTRMTEVFHLKRYFFLVSNNFNIISTQFLKKNITYYINFYYNYKNKE